MDYIFSVEQKKSSIKNLPKSFQETCSFDTKLFSFLNFRSFTEALVSYGDICFPSFLLAKPQQFSLITRNFFGFQLWFPLDYFEFYERISSERNDDDDD